MKLRLYLIVAIALVSVLFVFYNEKIKAPADFPIGSMYTIETGSGLTHLALDLRKSNLIQSVFWFKVFSVLSGGTRGVQAGDYVFNEEENVISLAERIAKGKFGLAPVKITIPEGLNSREIDKLLRTKFSKINETMFLGQASSSEGYLFPDTYIFLPNVTAAEVIKKMTTTFDLKIKILDKEITNFKKPLADIVKVASILELEARTTETRRMVADILWRRLALGMPLQVDASFKYINGKTTKTLVLDDLKFDSPYNSYLYKGLPPTPISNPGLDSLKAAVTPTPNPYLYFLTDDAGKMHYAKTFAEHLQNKENYLK